MLKIIKSVRIYPLSRRGVVNIRWYSDEESSDDDERKKKEKNENSKKNSQEALKRLNSLLESMSTTKTQPISIVTAKNLRKKAAENKIKAEKEATDLKSVTQKIAQKIGGDVQKTESELLSVLLGTSSPSGQKSKLSDIIGGLKVEDEKPTYNVSRAQVVKSAMNQYGKPRRTRGDPTSSRPREKTEKKSFVDFFNAKPLNIFSQSSTEKDPLETWSRLEERELKLAVTHPPRNYFEKMIMWTEQGKIWKFPIDNEQGMDVEKATDFTEHVMLEMHLEGWCPSRGPIRHFMELVCVGLGKNNFLSAQEKKDHIMWYRDYFESKRDVLGELLTLELNADGIDDGKKEQKQIES